MSFQTIRKQIQDITAPKKHPQSQILCRTVYFVLDKKLSNIVEWYKTWFPVKEEVDSLSPWITEAAEIEEAINTAFSVGVDTDLTDKGYSVISSINQILFVGDLSDPEVLKKTLEFNKVLDERLQKFITVNTPVFKVGLFLLRNIETKEGKNYFKPPIDFNGFMDNTAEIFHRIFLIDVANPLGVFINSPDNLESLIGQLLFYLSELPKIYVGNKDPQGFAEWLNRDRVHEGEISSFSGMSMLVPIDQILETAVVIKGSEILKEAVFAPLDQIKVESKKTEFLNGAYLNSVDTLEMRLMKHPLYPLLDPLKVLPDWKPKNTDKFLSEIDRIDASLPDFAEENDKIMEKIAAKQSEDWKHALKAKIDEIIMNEEGGFDIVKAFLKELKDRTKRMVPEYIPDPAYGDPSTKILEIKALLKNGPSQEAVIARTLLLSLMGVLGFFSLFNGLKELVGICAWVLLTGFMGFIRWHSFVTALERKVIQLKELLSLKWKALLENKVKLRKKDMLNSLVELIDLESQEVEKAKVRTERVFEYFENEYTAPEPQEYAFWRYVIKEHDDIAEFAKLIQFNIKEKAQNFLRDENILEFWRRFDLPEAKEPNNWEWALLEKGCVYVLPHCAEILNISACNLLRKIKQRRESFIKLMEKNCEPFLRLKAGSPVPEPHASIEISKDGCDDIYSEISSSVRGRIPDVRRSNSLTSYRISFFGIIEGINRRDIRLE